MQNRQLKYNLFRRYQTLERHYSFSLVLVLNVRSNNSNSPSDASRVVFYSLQSHYICHNNLGLNLNCDAMATCCFGLGRLKSLLTKSQADLDFLAFARVIPV